MSDEEYDYFELRSQMESEILDGCLHYKKGQKQPWTVIPRARLIKIWSDFAKTGIVRDEKGLKDICEILITNIAKLGIDNALMGHDTYDEIENCVIENELTKRQKNKLIKVVEETDYLTDDEGNPYISDYGLPKLDKVLFKLLRAKTAEEKILLVDEALNVVHQRSDLARWFVEGGSRTLSELAER